MIVLTVGKSYIDIDGYASSIAYRELLKLQGIEAKFVSNASLNYSITDSLKNNSFAIDKYNISSIDKFIVLDLSNPMFFPEFVKEDNIIEIIDHHPGYEEYWDNKLHEKSIIEKVGSVATIIVEKYEKLNLLDKINIDVAKLLMAAILDNTLNFTAEITTQRDKEAYKKLELKTKEYNYDEIYFNECQKYIENNLEESIHNDIKIQKNSKKIPEVLGQLTIWDTNILLKKIDVLRKIMESYNNDWILNIISLKDNKSYIICSNDKVKSMIENILDCYNKNDILVKDPAILRKEIMGKAL